jgi:hypothetical protein
MTDTLEQELRLALAEKAAAFPAGAHERLEQIDYGPKNARLRRRTAFGLAGLATVAAIAVVIALLSSSTPALRQPASTGHAVVPAAFVGWTPAPSKATAKRIAVYAKRCRWAASYRSQLKAPLIADIRGPYTALLFVDERENYQRFCLYGPHVGLQGAGTLAAPPVFESAPIGPRGIEDNHMGGSCDPADGRAVTQMHGPVGAEVIGATFVFANGAKVDATVRKGYYFAWWPWSDSPKSITVYTTSGTTHVTLPESRWGQASRC